MPYGYVNCCDPKITVGIGVGTSYQEIFSYSREGITARDAKGTVKRPNPVTKKLRKGEVEMLKIGV